MLNIHGWLARLMYILHGARTAVNTFDVLVCRNALHASRRWASQNARVIDARLRRDATTGMGNCAPFAGTVTAKPDMVESWGLMVESWGFRHPVMTGLRLSPVHRQVSVRPSRWSLRAGVISWSWWLGVPTGFTRSRRA